MPINQWPKQERPREKLLQRGAQSLSDAELLAIFLRTGIAGKSAVDLARDLLSDFNGLRPLMDAREKDFCARKGLGPAKYVQLQAVLEMNRRHLSESIDKGDGLTSPAMTRQFLMAQLRNTHQEQFACLFMDSQHRVICFEILFRGTIDSASVYPREVVRKALQHDAAAIIVAHNHPSGIAEPSRADESITQHLKKALSLVDVRLLDHFIVGDSEVVSLAERGMV